MLSLPFGSQLDPKGYKAAAGAANKVNRETGTVPGTALGFEIVLT